MRERGRVKEWGEAQRKGERGAREGNSSERERESEIEKETR